MDVHLPRSGTRGQPAGTRICLLLAALAVIGAIYLLISPLERPTTQGPPFDCGSALMPAGGGFADAVCGDINLRRQLQTGALGLSALVLAGGGLLAFGPAWRRDPRAEEDADPDRPVGREPLTGRGPLR